MFVMGFVYMKEEIVSPTTLFIVSALATSLSYSVHVITSWDERTNDGKNILYNINLLLVMYMDQVVNFYCNCMQDYEYRLAVHNVYTNNSILGGDS